MAMELTEAATSLQFDSLNHNGKEKFKDMLFSKIYMCFKFSFAFNQYASRRVSAHRL